MQTKWKIRALFHTGMYSKRAIFLILNLLQSCLVLGIKDIFLTPESTCPNVTRNNRNKPSISGVQCTDSGRPLATQDRFWLNSVLHVAQVEALEGPVLNLQCSMTMTAARTRGGLQAAVLKNTRQPCSIHSRTIAAALNATKRRDSARGTKRGTSKSDDEH